jgi:DNA repair protein RadC
MSEQDIINQALTILESRLHKPSHYFEEPQAVKNYLKLHCAEQEHESFFLMLLNNKHGLITLTELFRGTIDAATIYPREVVKTTLQFNAAAVVLAHNHPSGDCTASFADQCITQKLVKALKLIDVPVLDHIIVGHGESYSFAEHGLI